MSPYKTKESVNNYGSLRRKLVVCESLHQWSKKKEKISFPFDQTKIPKNGIYLLFEKGETAHNTDRIVRIGTHTGNDQLPSRLQQHFLNPSKDRSIFRKNIGRAMLNKRNDPYRAQWELDMTTKSAKKKYAQVINKEKQNQIEQEISHYIQKNFSFTVIPVQEKNDRLALESKIISTVSNCNTCKQSKSWLGNYSPKEKIKQSGLWQVNELYKIPLTSAELVLLEKTM